MKEGESLNMDTPWIGVVGQGEARKVQRVGENVEEKNEEQNVQCIVFSKL